MNEIDGLVGKPGESVPVVDAADIRVMWTYCQDLKVQHPGSSNMAVGMSVWKELCSPGADIRAVFYRCSMLGRWR